LALFPQTLTDLSIVKASVFGQDVIAPCKKVSFKKAEMLGFKVAMITIRRFAATGAK
jgi:hypothetical protein